MDVSETYFEGEGASALITSQTRADVLEDDAAEPSSQLRTVVLDDVVQFVRRYVVLTDTQADAIALWCAHTHAADAADTTPYLFFTSAEKRSGKTRALEVLELVVHVPISTANSSDAALFRTIAELKPTILFDEVDAIFGNKARDREDLRGLLNAGYRRGLWFAAWAARR